MGTEAERDLEPRRTDAVTDLALTIPVFVLYHLGVAFLPVVNAADVVTVELRALAAESLPTYALLTLALGAAFAAVVWLFGEKGAFDKQRFVWIAAEGAVYAALMQLGATAATDAATALGPIDVPLAEAKERAAGVLSGVTLSLGAGFYEEITFRVLLFGGGGVILRGLVGKGLGADLAVLGWAVAAAAAFSGWHYVGALGDAWDLQSFVFRWACGLVLTLVYWFRGFAPAVWAHALYDVWALVF